MIISDAPSEDSREQLLHDQTGEETNMAVGAMGQNESTTKHNGDARGQRTAIGNNSKAHHLENTRVANTPEETSVDEMDTSTAVVVCGSRKANL
jgi:hypothetical protein